MHPNALLELATELIHQVLQFQAPADSVVSNFFRQHKALGARERHTLAETTYTVLRQRALFQHLAQSGKGELERRGWLTPCAPSWAPSSGRWSRHSTHPLVWICASICSRPSVTTCWPSWLRPL